MKLTSNSLYLKLATIALAVSFGLSAYALTPREDLIRASHMLEKANNDYAGHRVKALEEVRAAGRDLGIDLGGALPEAEGRWESDKKLMEARRVLRDALNKMDHKERERVAARLEVAIKEIDIALKGR